MSVEPIGTGEPGDFFQFSCITSNGGPYDDEAFVCGWQLGALDMVLTTNASDDDGGDPCLPIRAMPIRRACLQMVDLIAMNYGLTVTVHPDTGPLDDTWAVITIYRKETAP